MDAVPFSPPQARRFRLAQRSTRLDPSLNAYRGDLADVELAGQVIASHYAEPVIRHSVRDEQVTADASAIEPIEMLLKGASFALLDCAHGRGWGYVVATHRVGYVDEDALG